MAMGDGIQIIGGSREWRDLRLEKMAGAKS